MEERKAKLILAIIIGVVLGFAGFTAVVCGTGTYTLVSYCDGCFVGFAITAFVPAMSALIRTGSFDVLNYSVYRFFESFKGRGEVKRWDSAYDYQEDRKQRRSKEKFFLWPTLCVSGLFLVAAIVLFVVYKCV